MRPDPRSERKSRGKRCIVCDKPRHNGAPGKDQRKSKGRK